MVLVAQTTAVAGHFTVGQVMADLNLPADAAARSVMAKQLTDIFERSRDFFQRNTGTRPPALKRPKAHTESERRMDTDYDRGLIARRLPEEVRSGND